MHLVLFIIIVFIFFLKGEENLVTVLVTPVGMMAGDTDSSQEATARIEQIDSLGLLQYNNHFLNFCVKSNGMSDNL